MGQNTNTFVWHDLNTTDKEGAEAFYSALFGWRFEAHPKGGGYTAMKHGDHDFGGLELARGGAPAHWLGYVDVDDLTERVAKLSKMGAKTLAPEMDIPNVGKIAVVADPSGAAFALYQQLEGANANWAPSRTNPGDFGWAEVVAEDADQAKGFYGEGFGWVAQQTMPTPDAAPYFAAFLDDPSIGVNTLDSVADGLGGVNDDPVDTLERNRELKELLVARGLYACGDFEGRARGVLERYKKDLHGHYARHARAILSEDG